MRVNSHEPHVKNIFTAEIHIFSAWHKKCLLYNFPVWDNCAGVDDSLTASHNSKVAPPFRPNMLTYGSIKARWRQPWCQIRDSKMMAHRPMSDIIATLSHILYTVYGWTNQQSNQHYHHYSHIAGAATNTCTHPQWGTANFNTNWCCSCSGNAHL